MLRRLVLFLSLCAGPAMAACDGTDLVAALPAAERAALRAEAATHPHSEGLLWRAEKDGRMIHLVGTMHVPDPRHAATLDRIRPVLDAAEHVFLEFGEGDEARLQRMVAEQPELAFITEGPTLPDLLGKADWDRLRAALSERGVPGFLAAKMKPWMAMANLAVTACDLQDLKAGRRGLDGMVIEDAAEMGKAAEALEPLDTALSLFAAFSQAEQLDMLRLGLAQQAQDSADQAVTLAEAYFREEIQLIWEFSMRQMAAHPDAAPEDLKSQIDRFEQVFVTARNAAWIDRILSVDGPTLVAVGAMHLPGESGLLRQLEDAGYTVTRLPLAQ
ncbi:TraB/GumN family protein [Psychromarinibacter sp. C21-152]|uniref:TraB/GumN family protein n=1 Tax=Psychromarinibacter sediminicola TaxID=3033385 RepID=A0AAE3NS84_9RHOB|nr:TraB/GumN family protein [Psychromarinibacter sediminicola]MDF0601519.1 TraB/GumN family protein [Psychromarinibacter sediminicola]